MPFLYELAGKYAPKSVRLMIEAWRKAPLSERKRTPLLYVLLGDGTPLFKLDKTDAFYVDDTYDLEVGFGEDGADTNGYRLGQKCKNCRSLFEHKTSGVRICDQVKGEVLEEGWCNRWEAPWPVEVFREYQEVGRAALKR